MPGQFASLPRHLLSAAVSAVLLFAKLIATMARVALVIG